MPSPPPIGVAPKWIRQEERLEELCRAVVRFREAALAIPREWLKEIRELAGALERRSEDG